MPDFRHTLLAFSTALLVACSTVPTEPVQDAETTPAPAAAPAEPVEYADFDPDTLYTLMVAEIAAQRGRYDVTLVNYLQAARKTHDLAVVQHAMRVAQFLKAENAQIEVAKVWLEIDPDNLEAHQISAFQRIRKNDFPEAMTHMEAVMRLGGDADFDRLAAYSQTLPREEQDRLLKLFRELQQRHPDNLEVSYSLALVLKNTGRNDESVAVITPVLDQHPDYLPAIFLYGTLLFEQGKIEDSLRYLRKNSRRFPEDRKIGTLYARLLVEDKQLQAAEDEFERLMMKFPDTPGIKLSHALVALENNNRDVARKELTELLDVGEHVNEAHYYLGRIDDDAGQVDAAIEHYLQVEAGAQYFAALSRAMFLTAQSGALQDALGYLAELRDQTPAQSENLWIIEVNLLMDLDETGLALTSADSALTAFPANTRLRYARAMLRDKSGDIAGMEQDLKEILVAEPENAVAMNALGYTLIDKTDRIKEGMALVERAYRLKPDNPAILDSLGWGHFKLGNLDKARALLEQAHAAFEDPEIAAHLGELYWKIGDEQAARITWRRGLETFPDAPVILRTMERLGVSRESP